MDIEQLKSDILENKVKFEDLSYGNKIYFSLLKEDDDLLNSLLNDVVIDLDFLESISSFSHNYLDKIIPLNLQSYKMLRNSDIEIYRLFAINNIAPILESIENQDKLDIVKEISNVDLLRAEINGIDIIYDNSLVRNIVEELKLDIMKFDKDVACLISIDVQEKIIFNEEKMEWTLETKKKNSIKDWAIKFKDSISEIAVNIYTNPTARKMAVASAILGVALISPDALADMNDAADTIQQMGEQLSSSIGDSEGDCVIRTNVVSVSKTNLNVQFTFGNYRVDTHASGFDAGSVRSLDLNSKIGILKEKMDCGLTADNARDVKKIIEGIIRKRL